MVDGSEEGKGHSTGRAIQIGSSLSVIVEDIDVDVPVVGSAVDVLELAIDDDVVATPPLPCRPVELLVEEAL